MRWPWEPFAEECKTEMRKGGDTQLFCTFFIFFVFPRKIGVGTRLHDYTITIVTEILAGMVCCNWAIAGTKK